MKKPISLALAACCCVAWIARAQAPLTDWVTDGGDNQRTGWAKNEKILTKDNVKNLKLLWTMETENQPRALHSLNRCESFATSRNPARRAVHGRSLFQLAVVGA